MEAAQPQDASVVRDGMGLSGCARRLESRHLTDWVVLIPGQFGSMSGFQWPDFQASIAVDAHDGNFPCSDDGVLCSGLGSESGLFDESAIAALICAEKKKTVSGIN